MPYPTACSPQAWAATAPILLLTSLMRYDAHVSRGGVWLDPVLPEAYGGLHMAGVHLWIRRCQRQCLECGEDIAVAVHR